MEAIELDLKHPDSGQALMPVIARDDFISGMRGVANSVCVVTTDGPAGRHGATVSAFSSVSADPPTVLVCLNQESRIARLVKANGAFAVNVLPSGSADLALRFAGSDDVSLKAVQNPPDGVCDRFDGVALESCADQPVLRNTLAFACRVTDVRPVASHAVVIAEVTDLQSSDQTPLVYADGNFRSIVALEQGDKS